MGNHAVFVCLFLSLGVICLSQASQVESWIAVWDCNAAGNPISRASALHLVKPTGCISQRIIVGISQTPNQGQVAVYSFDRDVCNAKLEPDESAAGLSQRSLQGKSPKFYSWHKCVNTPIGKVLFQKVEAAQGRIPAFNDFTGSKKKTLRLAALAGTNSRVDWATENEMKNVREALTGTGSSNAKEQLSTKGHDPLSYHSKCLIDVKKYFFESAEASSLCQRRMFIGWKGIGPWCRNAHQDAGVQDRCQDALGIACGKFVGDKSVKEARQSILEKKTEADNNPTFKKFVDQTCETFKPK